MVHGEKKIGTDYYFFDMVTGTMITDAYYEGYYYGTDGKRTGLHSIMGNSSVSVAQMVNFYNKYSPIPYPSEDFEKGGASSIEEMACIFYEEAASEGIKVEVAWAQTMLETGYFKFGGQVKRGQFNFAGLGAIDGDASGADFSAFGNHGVRMGVRAQIQHLKAYASTESLNNTCVDPRFSLVTPRGCAEYVEYLGQKENPIGKGWATSKGYGNNIVRIMNLLLMA